MRSKQIICGNISAVPLGHTKNPRQMARWNGAALAPAINCNRVHPALGSDFASRPGAPENVFDLFTHAPHNDYFSHSVKGQK